MGDRTPVYGRESFECPHCGAFAQQIWYKKIYATRPSEIFGDLNLEDLARADCIGCRDYSLWRRSISRMSIRATGSSSDWQMIWPLSVPVERPNENMPEGLRVLFEEARAVYAHSPRSSAALLRLTTEGLLREVTGRNDRLNDMIGDLVREGTLNPRLQKTADALRLIGNDAVHPSDEMTFTEGARERAAKLFTLVNLLVEELITRPGEIDDLYQSLPENKREQVEKRDQPST